MKFDNIKWFYDRMFNFVLEPILSMFIKKDKALFLFGCKPEPYTKDLFIHNTKYLYLYMQNNTDIRTIWLCDDKQMLNEFHRCGYQNVVSRKSLKGIIAILKAKYWFCDITPNQVTRFNSSNNGAISINFWHGAGGLKRVGYDADNQYNFKKNSIKDKIYTLIKPNVDYWIVNSKYESDCRKSAFDAKDDEIITLGSPRLDVLYHDISNAEIFMEEDFNNIRTFKEQGKKLIIYMPTFRDTGKNISGWLQSENLQKFLKDNNTILLCKLHPKDKTDINFKEGNIYKISNESDVYPILRYTDGLITDYSSIYFDYLHLDKPIIYHIPDLEEYTEQCRGFYRPYETLTAGVYTKTEEELLKAIIDVINGIDNYKDKRKALLDEMFVYQDGKNCERVIEWIKSLN